MNILNKNKPITSRAKVFFCFVLALLFSKNALAQPALTLSETPTIILRGLSTPYNDYTIPNDPSLVEIKFFVMGGMVQGRQQVMAFYSLFVLPMVVKELI